MKTGALLIMSIAAATLVAAEPPASREEVTAIAWQTYSNAVHQARTQYASISNLVELMPYVWSNYWLAANELAKSSEEMAEAVNCLFALCQTEVQLGEYQAELAKWRATVFAASKDIVEEARKLRGELSKRETGRLRSAVQSGDTVAGRLREVEQQIDQERRQFENMKQKTVGNLERSLGTAQRQMKSLQHQATRLKMPAVPARGGRR